MQLKLQAYCVGEVCTTTHTYYTSECEQVNISPDVEPLYVLMSSCTFGNQTLYNVTYSLRPIDVQLIMNNPTLLIRLTSYYSFTSDTNVLSCRLTDYKMVYSDDWVTNNDTHFRKMYLIFVICGPIISCIMIAVACMICCLDVDKNGYSHCSSRS